jgi:hypothetical protein
MNKVQSGVMWQLAGRASCNKGGLITLKSRKAFAINGRWLRSAKRASAAQHEDRETAKIRATSETVKEP